MAGEYTHREILSQPEAWASALEYLGSRSEELESINPNDYDEVIFTGCGSTYYLALAASALFREVTGLFSRGLPASEIWLYPRSAYNPVKKTLLVAISRSGTTTETIRAAEGFERNGNSKVLTLSCYPDSALAQLGHINLVFSSGQERSVAQTRAFSVLYLATVALTRLWSHQDLSALSVLAALGRRLLDRYAPLAKHLGKDKGLERFYFLGSGARYGLACELSLKMKEMSLSHSEPFHFMEFRHGPQSMVTDDTLIVGLVSEASSQRERAVLAEMGERGAQVLALADRDAKVSFESSLAEPLRNVLYLPIVQLLAFERSLSKNLNPDKPHNLTAVVILD